MCRVDIQLSILQSVPLQRAQLLHGLLFPFSFLLSFQHLDAVALSPLAVSLLHIVLNQLATFTATNVFDSFFEVWDGDSVEGSFSRQALAAGVEGFFYEVFCSKHHLFHNNCQLQVPLVKGLCCFVSFMDFLSKVSLFCQLELTFYSKIEILRDFAFAEYILMSWNLLLLEKEY